MLSPLKAILRRLAIPACGLVSVALLAISYVDYSHIYRKAMTAIIVSPGPRPFVDWQEIPAAIRCWDNGIDVYVNNPCFTIVPNDVFNYSPLWLRITFIKYAEAWTNFFGLSFAALFFLSLSLLPPPRTKFDFLITFFSAISSVTAFAVERANVDLVMFVMVVVGVLACGSRLTLRLAGYAVITLGGLLKFYPMAALIMAIRERPVVFATVALAAIAALGGLVFSYDDEVRQMIRDLPLGALFHPFHPLEFSAYDLPNGLAVMTSHVATKLFHQDGISARAPRRLVYNSVLLLSTVLTLASAIWLGHRNRLQYALRQLDREADFLFAGAAILCACFFAGENVRYRAIFLLLALPGLLALPHRLPSTVSRASFRGSCVVVVFLLWFPFVQGCVRVAVAALEGLFHLNDQGPIRQARVIQLLWFCDQLAWWWIVIVLLAILGALALNSELWAALSRTAESYSSRAKTNT